MKQLITAAICILIVFSCKKEGNVQYKYYESGNIKEKIVKETDEKSTAYLYSEEGMLLKSAELKNGQFDGIAYSYFEDGSIKEVVHFKDGKKNGKMTIYNPDGKIHMIRTFVNDTIHGITQLFTKKGGSLQNSLHIKGKQITGDLIYFNENGSIAKIVNHVIDSSGEYIPKGQLVLDVAKNTPIKDISFYYFAQVEKDTMRIGGSNAIDLEFVHTSEWEVEAVIGEINESLDFISDTIVYSSNNNKVRFPVEPKNTGWNLVTGKLYIYEKGDKRTHEDFFLIYKEFYVTE